MSIRSRLIAAWRALAGYHMQEWSTKRTSYVMRSQGARRDIPYGVRRKILDWSREMERKDAIFNRFLDLCEQYIAGPSGLRIVSASKDTAWAQRANASWAGWQAYCDVATRFSFGVIQGLLVRETAVAGEVFIYLTYGSTGKPRIQLIPSESIETPLKLQNDKDVFDGIRHDSNLRPLEYFMRVDETRTVALPADSVVHYFEPSRIGQMRGLPMIYPVLKDMVDLQELQDLEMLAAKDAAETSKVIKTATGEIDVPEMIRSRVSFNTKTPAGTSTTSTKQEYYQEKLGGRNVVLQNGDDYQQFSSNRPSVAVQQFWDYIAARTAAGLGIPLEIILLRSLQGTVARGMWDMANGYFRSRSTVLGDVCGRIWEHVIAGDLGLRAGLPGDWRSIRWTPPRAINVDVGRNSAAVVNEWETGFRTLESIASETGQDWRDILRQRAEEASYARDIETQFNLPPGTILSNQPEINQPFETNSQ